MRRSFLAFSLLALLFFACNSNEDSHSTTDATANATGEEEEVVDLQGSFPDLFAFLKKQDNSFSVEKFAPAEGGNLNSQPATGLNDNLNQFKPYLIYSTDSALAIDLYSYNHLTREKGSKQVLEMASPDSEVALVDLNNKTRQRILFTGPSTLLLDAHWTSPKELLLAGADQIDDQSIKPLLWKINIADSSMITFSYSDTVHAKVYGYTEQKFNAE